MQIFKEAYLPVIIAAVAVVLIIVFIIGSISRAVQKNKFEKQASIEASISQAAKDAELAAEADRLLEDAKELASMLDYDGAIAALSAFTGDISKYPQLSDALNAYQQEKSQLIPWSDPNQVVNLSFQLLIADPARAFNHPVYADSFNRNFITTDEFRNILQQLYENGYILVRMSDFITEETAADGTTVYNSKPIYLPRGKKPLMLTQTNVNYNIYLIDGDGDKLPDKDGGGFASKMVLDENGKITCEMIDRDGQPVTGDFDLVPILDSFIEAHPDFSYKGAKATLALTGYNGLLGYRTNASAKEEFGETAYERATEGATEIIAALKDSGYEFACYTYENIPYGTSSLTEIQADLSSWQTEVEPLLGKVDTLVYAQLTDITSEQTYSGEKYDALKNAGFDKFLGFCEEGALWTSLNGDYVRQGRILVTGSSLANHPEWFTVLFDTVSVLDSMRSAISE